MSTIFGVNPPSTDLRKNAFDLSEKALYSLSAGMLLPCFTKELNPGEKVKLNISAITRTQPLNTSAFVRSRQYFHFFFVPFRQLWSGWDNFINGVDYKTSALQKGRKYSMCPSINLFKTIQEILRSEDGSAPGLFKRKGGISKGSYKSDIFGIPYYIGMSRLLDMLEYGFTTPLISKNPAYVDDPGIPGRTDILQPFSSEMPYLVNNVGINSLHEFIDNLDKFDVGALPRFLGKRVNLLRLLAYQKIYSDFYKRDDYEPTDPLSFNFDDFTEDIDTLSAERLLSICQLRYRWLPKDYFTGVVPSELFNVPSSVGSSISMPSDFTGMSFNADDGKDVKGSVSGDSFSTRSIRAAFAIEKQLRLTRRASGQDYISQISAHYGFTPPKGRGDKVDFLGGFHNDINISDVINTGVNDSTAQLGSILGKGIGGMELSNDINFTAPEHGLIMCITSVVPELDYSCIGINSFNSKFYRGDYFHPEFQDLGLQPLFSHELYNDMANSDDSKAVIPSVLLGYVPRYSEYKTSYDKLFGEFRNGKGLSAWSADVGVGFDKRGIIPSTLRVSPMCLNRIFSVVADGRSSTDQFLTNSQVVCKVIRPMSRTGQNL